MNDVPIRVLIADDHVMVRMGLASLVADSGDMLLVAEARNGREAIEAYRQHVPDITLMDGILPDMHGTDAIRAIRGEFPDARILLISINEGAEDVQNALRAGAHGYVPKSGDRGMILSAIRTVATGRNFIPPELRQKLVAAEHMVGLSARELDVIRLVAKGNANKEVASSLGLSENTVKTHLSNIMAKLGAPDRTRAVTIAIERGILKL